MAVLPTGIGPVTGGYQIERSLRFNSADSAYLNRTPASAGNRKTWTWSGWVKRSTLGTVQGIFDAYSGGLDFATAFFNTDNTIYFYSCSNSGSFIDYDFTTTAVFRDVGAWYHIVLVLNTVSATQADRFIVYVNGVRQTGTNPSGAFGLNDETYINSTVSHRLGSRTDGSYYSNGYMAEVNFINGQALTPSDFGETDSNTGVWKPKAYTGTYGTNGFYLKFADNSGTTSTTLGKDSSGNGNNWTPNNFSVTAGAGNDSLVDSPTSYGTDTGVGGTVRGNYCTFNPLNANSAITLSNGNLTITQSNNRFCGTTIPVASGKWYFEYLPANTGTGNSGIGVIRASDNVFGSDAFSAAGSYAGVGYLSSGNKNISGTITSYGATYVSGDVIGVAIDLDSGTQTITFYKNNTSQGSINIPTASQTWMVVCDGATSVSANINFGQRAFAYTAPSGFKALCTQNLPTPTIGATSTTQANDYFDVKTWSGNSSTQSIALEFAPGLIWNKSRSGAAGHSLWDVLRGTGAQISSSEINAESTGYNAITSFSSNAISLGADNTGTYNGRTNETGRTYVGWVWNAGGSNATNTSGSITSTVRANTTSGFSIATLTAQSSGTGTFGHGLGVAPSMVIVKQRASAGAWVVYHTSIGNGSYLILNTTAASVAAASYWNSTSPSSTVVTLGTAWATTGSLVAYCFAPVAGYSAFGSYTGNGSADGTFVYTGFRPRYVLTKEVSASGNEWFIWDSARDTYNQMQNEIFANKADAENATGWTFQPYIDFTSNGFKLRSTNTHINGSGSTLIYAAFAEHPFKYSLAR